MNVAICDDDINVANLIEDILSNMSGMEFSSDVFLSGVDLLRCFGNTVVPSRKMRKTCLYM